MYKVTICGSFHVHINIIQDAIQQFQENDCEVLSPRDARIVAEIGDFLFVESDHYRSVLLVENRHLISIDASDFVWVVAPDGYIGQSTSLEIGYAIAKGKLIFCERIPPDLTLAEYVCVCESPLQAIQTYRRVQVKQKAMNTNLLLDPTEGGREAHGLIDKIVYLLEKPGLIKPSDLEKEVNTLTLQLMTILNLKFRG